MKKGLVINCSPVKNGATAEIVKIISEELSSRYDVRSICIDDYDFAFCRGCRACHNTMMTSKYYALTAKDRIHLNL